MSEPMSDERLAEIETDALYGAESGDTKQMNDTCTNDVPELVAEVRRLRLREEDLIADNAWRNP